MNVNEDRLRDMLIRGLVGDGTAYHVFLTELSAHLRAFFRRRLGRLLNDVEDLVQETVMAVHIQRHTYQKDQPLIAWFRAIAHYSAIEHYKMVGMLRRHRICNALIDPWDDELDILVASATETADVGRDVGGSHQGKCTRGDKGPCKEDEG